ncbi:MAG TPA: substrate-binding domain-containing protein [Tepidisphaeraceae bacterium]|nr:substrate-binding domain-containing protein [Tepidisphaeraceae bacterium]
MRNSVLTIALMIAAFLVSCNRDKGGGGIAVIPKGTTHVYWKSVQAGAQQAGKDLNVRILWKGPLKENDRQGQISVVEQFVGDKVDAIVLAPLDDKALVKPVREAGDAKIPVVIIDSALQGQPGKDFVSYVATDNRKGGEIAGTELARLLHGKGKVVLLRYMEGSASTADREAGFLAVMKQNPGIVMLADNRFAGATASEAQSAAMNMLDQIGAADGVFCPNESSTFGMLLAMKQAGLAGKRKFVGFDATPQLVDALKAGDIDALVAQDPYKMGYEGVRQAVQAVQHKPVDPHVDTGVRLITNARLKDPAVQKLLAH